MKKIDYNIMLIGFMGSGKSAVSNELKNKLGMEELDMDKYIEEKEGRTINDMFEKDGEEYFRDRETEAVLDFIGKTGLVVSCGGGAVLREKNVELMKRQGKIILLTATPQTTYDRIKYSTHRPILNGNMNVEFIEELMKKRADIYKAAADIEIATDNKTIEAVCDEIISQL